MPGPHLKLDRPAQHDPFHYGTVPGPRVERHEPDRASPARPVGQVYACALQKVQVPKIKVYFKSVAVMQIQACAQTVATCLNKA
jgi:hypothetical protein